MNNESMKRPVVLMILDGWGYNPTCDNNAVCLADTPNLDALFASCPHTLIGASGQDVGLPDGQMGNSEVGHLNLGAGRVVYQDLTRISLSIEDGSLFDNPALNSAIDKVKSSGGKLHLMGLLSDGGVHSHNTHLYALVEMASKAGASHSMARTQLGATIVRFCSTSASSDAAISEIVANWPEGSVATEPTSAGEASTKTVASRKALLSVAGSSRLSTSTRGNST